MKKHINIIHNLLEELYNHKEYITGLSSDYIFNKYNIGENVFVEILGIEKEDIFGRYNDFISKNKNYISNKFYHYTNNKEKILMDGFDITKIEQAGVGYGLYMGKDKFVIDGFYGLIRREDDKKNIYNGLLEITINENKINFLDMNSASISENINLIFNKIIDYLDNLYKKGEINSYYDIFQYFNIDGIKYYDPLATGEEYVLYNLEKVDNIIVLQ